MLLRESESAYRAREEVSKSTLDWLSVSPLHYWARYVTTPDERIVDERTPAMLLGSLAHVLILEPEAFESRYAIAPDIDRRTKQGKADYEAFQREAAGREIVTADMLATAKAMAKAVSEHKAAASLLRHADQREMTVLWETDGIARRARVDAFGAAALPIVIDIKTTRDASPDGFSRAIAAGRYHVQAAWYLDGLAAQPEYSGARDWPFVWIAVESVPPYAVAVYGASERTIRRGRELADRDLARLAECRELYGDGPWPAYTPEPMEIDLPAWAQSDRPQAHEI